jgi:hypothetical protein
LLDFDSLGSSGSSSQQPALQPQQTAPASDPWGEFTGAKMDFSLTRQEKCDLLKQVASTGSFDCIGKENHINFNSN